VKFETAAKVSGEQHPPLIQPKPHGFQIGTREALFANSRF